MNKDLRKAAKAYANRPSDFNRTQFIVEFNELSDEDQRAAVAKGSELSFICLGWCAATRLEMQLEDAR